MQWKMEEIVNNENIIARQSAYKTQYCEKDCITIIQIVMIIIFVSD